MNTNFARQQRELFEISEQNHALELLHSLGNPAFLCVF